MTIEQYLQGKVDFNISDSTISAILFDRGIDSGTYMEDITERQKDLCLADLYMYVANSSTSSSSEYESDGGWQRQRSTKNVYNRAGWLDLAKRLYAKWGEGDAVASSSMVMKDLY